MHKKFSRPVIKNLHEPAEVKAHIAQLSNSLSFGFCRLARKKPKRKAGGSSGNDRHQSPVATMRRYVRKR